MAAQTRTPSKKDKRIKARNTGAAKAPNVTKKAKGTKTAARRPARASKRAPGKSARPPSDTSGRHVALPAQLSPEEACAVVFYLATVSEPSDIAHAMFVDQLEARLGLAFEGDDGELFAATCQRSIDRLPMADRGRWAAGIVDSDTHRALLVLALVGAFADGLVAPRASALMTALLGAFGWSRARVDGVLALDKRYRSVLPRGASARRATHLLVDAGGETFGFAHVD